MKGRPLKGESPRKPTIVYIAISDIAKMDEVVAARRAEGQKGYSRSEFIAGAIRAKFETE